MNTVKIRADQDFKAQYKFLHDCHIVKIYTYDKTGKSPSWRPITELFCANEEKAKLLTDKINEAFE